MQKEKKQDPLRILKKNSFSCFIYKIRENFRTFRFFLESLDKKGRQWQFYKAGFFL